MAKKIENLISDILALMPSSEAGATVAVDVRDALGALPTHLISAAPISEARQRLVEEIASRLERENHAHLSKVAAYAIEGWVRCEQSFREYAHAKEIELLTAREHLGTLPSKIAEMVHDPTVRAQLNAKIKVENDPKTAAKREAFLLWQERKDGLHPKLRRNLDFAIEVLHRWPVIKNVNTVTAWATQWEKDSKLSRTDDLAK